ARKRAIRWQATSSKPHRKRRQYNAGNQVDEEVSHARGDVHSDATRSAIRPFKFMYSIAKFCPSTYPNSRLLDRGPKSSASGIGQAYRTHAQQFGYLLCTRRERPRSGRAAERGYHIPPSDGDCHTPLPCEVRKRNDTTPRACCPLTARD